MRKFSIAFICGFLLMFVFNVSGLDVNSTLEYFEGGVYIDTPGGYHYESADLKEGFAVPVGSTISTEKDGSVELMLPDSTIIKLDTNTTFSLQSLKGVGNSKTTVLQLTYGKIRAVVTKLTSTTESFEFQGNASVCGVRGTGLVMWIRQNQKSGAEEESAYTLNGKVDYWKKSDPGKKIQLNDNQYADAFGDNFSAKPIPKDMIAEFNKNFSFKKVLVAAGKQDNGGEKPEATKEPEPTKEPEVKDTTKGDLIGNVPKEGEAAKNEAAGKEGAGMPDWLSKLLGFEIGSLTIGDKTYAKAVFQPTIAIDKLKLALYLPVIYEKNLFDPGLWYKPAGNNEWTFGFDQPDFTAGVGDFIADLFLKIKYLEWGSQRDPFFIKIGNIHDFTIGHGLLMDNYANDSEFPAIRKVGFDLGLDLGKFGIEFMSNDLATIGIDPRIVGLRSYIRPFAPSFPLAFGVSFVADFNPAAGLDVPLAGIDADMIGNPMFFNLGVDLDLPIVNTDPLRFVYFADLGGMLPFFGTQGTGPFSGITPGLHTEAIFTDKGLRNYGFSTGVLGNITFFTYKLDFRYMNGVFRHSFFDNAYDRNSGDIAIETAAYVANPNNPAFTSTLMGIYLEGGFKFDNICSFQLGYMLPMTINDSGFQFGKGEDKLHAQFVLEPKVFPFLNLSGSIFYDRSYFVSMLLGEKSDSGKSLSLFDEYTVLGGEIVYGMSKSLDLAFIVSTAVARDSATGAVIYESDGVTKKINATWTIETRIHF
jgi:hypothetical protein